MTTVKVIKRTRPKKITEKEQINELSTKLIKMEKTIDGMNFVIMKFVKTSMKGGMKHGGILR